MKDDGGPVLVRVHSECFTGDVLGSERCDCGPQLHAAIEAVEREVAAVSPRFPMNEHPLLSNPGDARY